MFGKQSKVKLSILIQKHQPQPIVEFVTKTWPKCNYNCFFKKQKRPYTNYEALQIVLHFINIFS